MMPTGKPESAGKERDIQIARAIEEALAAAIPDAHPIEIALVCHRLAVGFWRLAGYRGKNTDE